MTDAELIALADSIKNSDAFAGLDKARRLVELANSEIASVTRTVEESTRTLNIERLMLALDAADAAFARGDEADAIASYFLEEYAQFEAQLLPLREQNDDVDRYLRMIESMRASKDTYKKASSGARASLAELRQLLAAIKR